MGRLLSSGARGHPVPQANSPALERAATGRAIDLGRHSILGQEPGGHRPGSPARPRVGVVRMNGPSMKEAEWLDSERAMLAAVCELG